MSLVPVRFTKLGANSALGAFNQGDIARVGQDFAKHLVDEAKVAEYVEAPKPGAAAKRAPKGKE